MGFSESLESLRKDWRKALFFIHLFFMAHLIFLIACGLYSIQNANIFPYIDKSYLNQLLTIYYSLLSLSLLLLPLILKVSQKYRSGLSHTITALWSLFGFHFSFSLGFDTTPYGVSFLIVWSVSVLFLLGKSYLKNLAACAFFMLIVFGIYESNQIYSYAPLLSKPPFDENGVLYSSWRSMVGAVNFFVAIACIYLFNLTL